MSTCLLLSLISMVAVGATRAVVGGQAAPADDGAAVAEALADGTTSAAKPRSSKTSKTSTSKTASSRTAANRRAGGAVAPADALRGATDDEGDGS